MTFITWACLRYVQELTTILGPQNHTQGHCVGHLFNLEIEVVPQDDIILLPQNRQ